MLILTGPKLDYNEACQSKDKKASDFKQEFNIVAKNIGFYTEDAGNAKALAECMGMKPTVDDEYHGIGYIVHFHDADHSYHIWFGYPMLIDDGSIKWDRNGRVK